MSVKLIKLLKEETQYYKPITNTLGNVHFYKGCPNFSIRKTKLVIKPKECFLTTMVIKIGDILYVHFATPGFTRI